MADLPQRPQRPSRVKHNATGSQNNGIESSKLKHIIVTDAIVHQNHEPQSEQKEEEKQKDQQ